MALKKYHNLVLFRIMDMYTVTVKCFFIFSLKTKSTEEYTLKALFNKKLSPSIIKSDNKGGFIGEIERRFCKELGVGNVHQRLHYPHQKVREKILTNRSSGFCQGFHNSCSEFSKLMSGRCYS